MTWTMENPGPSRIVLLHFLYSHLHPQYFFNHCQIVRNVKSAIIYITPGTREMGKVGNNTECFDS